MIQLKDRIYKLTVINETISKSWDNLKLSFKATKTADISPNESEFTITNLSKDTINFISKKGNIIIFEAGYIQESGMIFKGTIETFNDTTNNTDIDLKITSKDGIKEFKNTILSKAFAPNTSEETVINYIIKELGIPKGTIKGIPTNNFKNGLTLSGKVNTFLDTYCKSRNLQVSIQDNILQIVPKSSYTNDTAILLDNESGLIGSPEKTDTGYKAKSLLRSGINPNSYIEIKSKKINGFFIVKKVDHEGDTKATPWYTNLELVKI